MKESNTSKVTFGLDLRLVVAALIVVIIAMLLMWHPWAGVSDRTIEVTGETTLKAVPDEFTFYPNYQFKNDNKDAALAELSKKSDEITGKLKELGVAETNIKTNSSGYMAPTLPPDQPTDNQENVYTLQITVTVPNQELAQKVQDYLVTTGPTGAISPQPTFSDEKRKELEATARDQATKNAKQKADQTAANLGFRLGAVKAVHDGIGFGGVAPSPAQPERAVDSLGVHPGENELSYSVTVTYYIR